MRVNFDEMFAPTLAALGLEQRPQQRHLGWAVVDSIEKKMNLVGEARTGTGKSFAYLVPSIYAVKNAPDEKPVRVIVSTETTALQDQLTNKDLPRLHQIYGGFRYRSLKGRSWYYCHNRARMNSRGSQEVHDLVDRLGKHLHGGLGDGERLDCEKRLGHDIDSHTWELIGGNSEFCADNKCKDDECFSSRARTLALNAHIVVTNHAMLRTEADMRDNEMSILGEYDILIVDEAHTLESVLVDGWTTSTSPWEIAAAQGHINDALQRATMAVSPRGALGEQLARAFDGFDDALKNITKFFKMRATAASDGRPVDWRRENYPLAEVYLSGSPASAMIAAMEEYETKTPERIRTLAKVLQEAAEYLKEASDAFAEQGLGGIRKVNKGARAARELNQLLTLVDKSLATRDGIVMHYGVPHGVIVEGLRSRNGGESVRLKVVPLDVSGRAAQLLWPHSTNILLSATLTDPTDGTFTYSASSLGIAEYQTVMVDSPFTYATQQLVYVTPAEDELVDVYGARYSLDELIKIVDASNGRTLILFTARSELDHAYEQLTHLQDIGRFKYPIYYQDKTTPKQKLVDAFREDEHSVLLATKSFFTGVDFPGATCTTVAICKFPLPQYNTLCKQRIAWWRSRGFSKWYERESLLVFAQAAGRLIRSETDHGVVALLDQRCADERTSVYRTSRIGITATGSHTTSSIADVSSFLKQKEPA